MLTLLTHDFPSEEGSIVLSCTYNTLNRLTTVLETTTIKKLKEKQNQQKVEILSHLFMKGLWFIVMGQIQTIFMLV